MAANVLISLLSYVAVMQINYFKYSNYLMTSRLLVVPSPGAQTNIAMAANVLISLLSYVAVMPNSFGKTIQAVVSPAQQTQMNYL